MERYDDEYEPRRAPGSRISVLLVGLIVGALIMTGVWVGIAGNPLSDENEVVYEEITVTDVNLDKNTVCWSEDPSRRDAGQVCAILALDRAQQPPAPGQDVTIGTVMLRPPDEETSRYAVYVSRPEVRQDSESDEPAPTESE